MKDPALPAVSGDAAGTPRDAREDRRAYAVSLLHTATGRHYEARGSRIRLGHGRECEIRLDRSPGVRVASVHAELTIGAAGGLVLRDTGSTHGTFVNGVQVKEPLPVRLGDRLTLGPGGPTLVVEGVGTVPLMPVARRRLGPARGHPGFLRATEDALQRRGPWILALVAVSALLVAGALYRLYRVRS